MVASNGSLGTYQPFFLLSDTFLNIDISQRGLNTQKKNECGNSEVKGRLHLKYLIQKHLGL